jgi:hypothetical protein
MSVSQQSVLGSSQNLIATHVAGCNPPALKNSIILPTTITTAAPYFANISGAIYTIPIVAAAATIVLPHVAVAKGYQFDFVFSANQGQVITFAPLTAAGVVGAATTTPVLAGKSFQRGPAPVSGSALSGLVTGGPLYLSFTAQSLFVVGVAGANPAYAQAGDTVRFLCDGTNWLVDAYSSNTSINGNNTVPVFSVVA